ncbi:rhomboid family intramembrane serine protease [Hydrogenophaga sp.]|uniref:rhomboid family intramembrane serine protease n=1 Tax=Hydrogenophaga sp. TaxID=1904254 RepID=UPI0025C29368|nr:rhomboid family intramembrane serine protease [Hydrogenophaga sp.]
MPPLTQALIVVNVLAFFAQQWFGDLLIQWFALWPLSTGLFMPWQLGSYAFLHGGLTHLAFNMYGVWLFGGELERVWGSRRLGAFFGVSALVAGASQLLVSAVMGSGVPTVGASGGLFGLLIGFAMVFPRRTIMPLLPPIPMPAPVFVALYGFIELTLGVTGSASGVAHFAHLGGLLGGWLVMRYWRGQIPFGPRY